MDPFPPDYYQSQENWKTNVTEGGGDFPTVVVSLNRFFGTPTTLSLTHTRKEPTIQYEMAWMASVFAPAGKNHGHCCGQRKGS